MSATHPVDSTRRDMPACQHCSAKVLPDDRVCKACGEPLPEPPDDAPDPLIGTVIADNFEILELLDEGAMGRVYRARQQSLDKAVAIKVLHGHLANDSKVAKRFHREARAASRLSHPNSLQIIDFGEAADGQLYIAMELLDGDDLLAIIEEDSPLTPRRIGDLLGQMLLALDEAHHAGIIHRDLKPENVVVLEGRGGVEHVKVCDFGIAKITEAEGGSAITVSGFVCGTPEYMAPEQARGDTIDGRVDIYSVGCMLYQMLTGVVPFDAESALGIITKHLTEQPVPPSERKPGLHIPGSLERICLRAMSKDPNERYPDAMSMRLAIEKAVDDLGALADLPLGRAHPESTRPIAHTADAQEVAAEPRDASNRALWIGAGFIVIGAIAFGLSMVVHRGGAQEGTGPQGRASIGETPHAGGTGGPAQTGGEPSVSTDAMAVLATTTDAGSGDGGADGDAGGDAGTEAVAITPHGQGHDPRHAGAGHHGPGHTGSHGTTSHAHSHATTTNGGPASGDTSSGTSTLPSPSPGQVAYQQGRRLFLANDLPGAIRQFEQAARLMPRNPDVQSSSGGRTCGRDRSNEASRPIAVTSSCRRTRPTGRSSSRSSGKVDELRDPAQPPGIRAQRCVLPGRAGRRGVDLAARPPQPGRDQRHRDPLVRADRAHRRRPMAALLRTLSCRGKHRGVSRTGAEAQQPRPLRPSGGGALRPRGEVRAEHRPARLARRVRGPMGTGQGPAGRGGADAGRRCVPHGQRGRGGADRGKARRSPTLRRDARVAGLEPRQPVAPDTTRAACSPTAISTLDCGTAAPSVCRGKRSGHASKATVTWSTYSAVVRTYGSASTARVP